MAMVVLGGGVCTLERAHVEKKRKLNSGFLRIFRILAARVNGKFQAVLRLFIITPFRSIFYFPVLHCTSRASRPPRGTRLPRR